MGHEITYVLWVDEGEGWYRHSSYSTEEEANKVCEKYDYDSCYAYVDKTE